jgi:hypothetical protein
MFFHGILQQLAFPRPFGSPVHVYILQGQLCGK